MTVPRAIRDAPYVSFGPVLLYIVTHILGLLVLAAAFNPRGFANVLLTTREDNALLRDVFVALVLARTASHIFWALFVVHYQMTKLYALGLALSQILFDAVAGVMVVWCSAPRLGLTEDVIVFCFVVGLVLERVADMQRRLFKRQSANQDKPYTGGVFRWIVHANYTGEAIWRIALWSLGGVGPMQLLNVYLLFRAFSQEISTQYERNVSKYGSAFETYWKKTIKIFPGVY